ncbi:accessory factor UbiK family protein [Amphritea sp. 2_MG-2023]|jgi:BMFP domain-containing protein YqiC|uniref:accessory factor UbiK family protein n=1 Tax=Amphritea TaxID=515417 RepID=UPI001C06B0E3|nr:MULTISPECIES: accessory factor UbiK family protein [Amphritea]MBU2964753.1 accessory factor UbiK family protein [Amphritea atlantica]MDO6417150.1 accessory factor UbiK family protein [Amphritea sp. 2_MG-2023]MDX2422788.1 accessory factor UbiK family protein [Amphritea sp.]
MINHKILEGISGQIGQLFEQTRQRSVETELQQQIYVLLQGAFSRMDLVTREEFDAQSAVLGRSRAKLEQLQLEIERLEQLVNKADS